MINIPIKGWGFERESARERARETQRERDRETQRERATERERDPTQPSKVDGDLLPKVLPDVVQRLVLVPLGPSSPILEQDLPLVQLIRANLRVRELVSALQKQHNTYLHYSAL